MPRKVPDDIGGWISGLRREEPEEFTTDEKRALNDLLHGVLRKALIHVAVSERDSFDGAEAINLLEPAGAAEVTRLYGGRRQFVRIIEQLWEMAEDVQP